MSQCLSYSGMGGGHCEIKDHSYDGRKRSEVDSQGRISLSSTQKDYANISKDVAIVGNIDYFEIWDKEKWEEFDGANVDMVTDDPSMFADLGI